MGCYVCPGLGAAVRCPGEHRCRQRGWGGGAAPAWHPQPLSLPCRQGGFRELPLIPLVPSLMLEPARWMLFPGGMRPAKLIAPTPAPGAAGLGGGLVFIPPTPPRLECQRLRSLWQPSPSLWLPWPPIPKMTHTHMGGPKHTRDTPPPHTPLPRQQELNPAPRRASCLRPAKLIAPQAAGAERLGLREKGFLGGYTEPPGLREGPRSCGIPPRSPSASGMTQGGLVGFVRAGTPQLRAWPRPCRADPAQRHGGAGGTGPAGAERHQDHDTPPCPVQPPQHGCSP